MSQSKHSARPRPMPIIVGVPRSGTTLLRMMLDAHSEMAIPPETGFIPDLMGYQTLGSRFQRALKSAIPRMNRHSSSENNLREIFYLSLIQSPLWPQFHIAHEDLRENLLHINRFTISKGLRTFYRLYAERFNKCRWGDKTPSYSSHLQAVEQCLPESRFIHIIRDGRDVAVSVRGLWFAPGDDIETIALDWRERIQIARRQAQHCHHYLEVFYEDLVAKTAETLRHICGFVDLPYETGMETYYLTASERLREYQGNVDVGGSSPIPEGAWVHWRLLTHPPETSRVGRWRNELTKEERHIFEKVAGDMLRELNYET